MKSVFYSLSVVLILSSCRCFRPVPADESTVQEKKMQGNQSNPKMFPAIVIDARGLDGCSFLLQLKDSTRLEPDRLDEKYRRDGRKVLIRFHEVKRMSVCMAGKPVIIDHIEFSEVK